MSKNKDQASEQDLQQEQEAKDAKKKLKAAEKAKTAKPEKEAKKKGSGKKVGRFIKDFRGEIKKISWPDFKTVMKNTLIVLATVVVIGAFIWILDFGLTSGIAGLKNLAQNTKPEVTTVEEAPTTAAAIATTAPATTGAEATEADATTTAEATTAVATTVAATAE